MCYDVADDARRDRPARVLLDFGKRVEESVFHCHLEPELAGEMLGRIRRTIDEAFDKVHVLPLCQACAAKIVTCGIAGEDLDPEFMDRVGIDEGILGKRPLSGSQVCRTSNLFCDQELRLREWLAPSDLAAERCGSAGMGL